MHSSAQPLVAIRFRETRFITLNVMHVRSKVSVYGVSINYDKLYAFVCVCV